VEDDVLTISYEQKEETKSEDYKTVRREFKYNSFKRSFTLNDKNETQWHKFFIFSDNSAQCLIRKDLTNFAALKD
jgi:hypothetical protein